VFGLETKQTEMVIGLVCYVTNQMVTRQLQYWLVLII